MGRVSQYDRPLRAARTPRRTPCASSRLYPVGYLPIFADAHNQRDRFERYLEMLLERHVDGLIVVANWLLVDIHVLADLNKREIPAATIGWELPGIQLSSVMVDNEAGGWRWSICYQLGHHRIAVIRGPKRLINCASLARYSEICAVREAET